MSEERRQPRPTKLIRDRNKVLIIVAIAVLTILIGSGIALAFTLSRTVNVTIVDGMTVTPTEVQTVEVDKSTPKILEPYIVTNTSKTLYYVTVANTVLPTGVSVGYDKTYFPLGVEGSTTVTATITADSTAVTGSFDITFTNDMT